MNHEHLWVKICGIGDVTTAVAVAESGADAIGLNFYERSPRCIDESTAGEIVKALPPGVTPVGLFVNHSTDEIRRISRTCGLTTVQLHGDEPVSMVRELSGLQVIRALRTSGDFASLATEQMEDACKVRTSPWAWLVDARSEHGYGGTGETVDWDQLTPGQRSDDWPPLILAGGLTPENIAEAVRTVRPWGVDVASGVESSPGVKDVEMVKTFISRAREAS